MCPAPKSSQTAAVASRIAGSDTTSQAMDDALDMLSAVDAAGLVLVPREPTADMLNAGANAGGVSPPTAYKMWRAMLGATE